MKYLFLILFLSVKTTCVSQITILGGYTFGSNPTNFVRLGLTLQIENKVKLFNNRFEITPFLDIDISAYPREGGIIITHFIE